MKELFSIIGGLFSGRDKELPRALPESPKIPNFGIYDWFESYGIVFTPEEIERVKKFPWSDEILKSPCPYHPGKTISETHFAFIGFPFDMSKFKKLNPKTGPRFHNAQQKNKFRKLGLQWHLAVIGTIPASKSKTFDKQKALLTSEYYVPLPIEELAKNIFYYIKTGKYLNIDSYSRTAGRDSINNVISIGCDDGGIRIGSSSYDHRSTNVGIAAFRKFGK